MSIPWTSTLRPTAFLLITVAMAFFGREVVQMLPGRPSPQWIATGLTLDIILGLPFVYWLLLVRGLGWPLRTILPVFLLSVVLASQLIPKEHAPILGVIHLLVIPLEFFVIGFVIVKTVRAMRLTRRRMNEQTDTWHALRGAARELVGHSRIADLAAFEVAIPYYAFAARRAKLDANTFSIDREIGYGAILGLLMLAVLVEVVVVHMVVVSLGGNIAAWIFTVLGIYGGVWLLADYRAIRNRAVILGEDSVTLRVGLRWEVCVPYNLIESIQPVRWSGAGDDRLSMSVYGDPKLELVMKQPDEVEGLYGMRRAVTRLGLQIDDQQLFVAALEARLAQHSADASA